MYTNAEIQQLVSIFEANSSTIANMTNYEIYVWVTTEDISARRPINISEFLEKAADTGVLQEILTEADNNVTAAVNFESVFGFIKNNVPEFDIDKAGFSSLFDDLVTAGIITAQQRTTLNNFAETSISIAQDDGLPQPSIGDVRKAIKVWRAQ